MTKMEHWDPEAYKKGIQSHVDKVMNILKSKEVKVSLVDDDNPKLNNLTFYGGGNKIKMSHHSFYRYSGRGMKPIAVGKQGKGEKNDYRYGSLPINEYMEKIIIDIILIRLKLK